MNPQEHRQLVLRTPGGGPDIQVQAVLLILGGGQELGYAVDIGGHLRIFHHLLNGSGGILGGPPDSPPAARGLGLPEPALPHRGCGIGDALEHLQISLHAALEPALGHLNLGIFKISHNKVLLFLF